MRRRNHRLATVIISSLALATLHVDLLSGQEHLDAARRPWALSGGFVLYETGGACGAGRGGAAALDVGTTGAWVLGAGVGVVSAGALECISVGSLGWFEGRHVPMLGRVDYTFAPQLRARAGRAVHIAGVVIEPAAVGGYTRADFNGDAAISRWRGWFGGSLRLGVAAFPLSLQVDHGRHSVPYRLQEDGVILHRFERWRPMTRIAVRW